MGQRDAVIEPRGDDDTVTRRGERWQVAGLVLCGGESRRMGQAKAWLDFGGQTVLERIVQCVNQVVAPVVVARRPGQSLPPLSNSVRIVEDVYPGRGPLAGLHIGLWALRQEASHALVVSCDVPLVRPAFLQRLMDAMRHAVETAESSATYAQACVPIFGGQRHPLVAIYAVALWPLVESLLRNGQLRPAFLLEQIPVRWLQPEEWADVDPESLSLTNINTPQEYQAALHRALAANQESPTA
ncbi:putative molybdenum cofactor guanylyltransferase [bacterium HR36]|uniref:Probable molybdenum cofactor guanylyltransferase n=1 Tax=uncultured Planctomycetota bacterium TaxID=120965 RepID=H5SLY5_9BACT|nr:molybdopterin-guanine dinucleotide biosynthesis protein A [uncultured Planctomycetota bacterium]GBD36321.1 putative molybdenum cofactor guanylyltransferase [bacterium HR36]